MALEIPDVVHATGMFCGLVPVPPPLTAAIVASNGFASFKRVSAGVYELVLEQALAANEAVLHPSLPANVLGTIGAQVRADDVIVVTTFDGAQIPADVPGFYLTVLKLPLQGAPLNPPILPVPTPVSLARTSYVYKPSEPSPQGNVYNDWYVLWNAVAAAKGLRIIWVDDPVSLIQTPSEPLFICDFEHGAVQIGCARTLTATQLVAVDGANHLRFVNMGVLFGSLTLINDQSAPLVPPALNDILVLADGAGFTSTNRVGAAPCYYASGVATDIYYTGRSNTIAASLGVAPFGNPALFADAAADVKIRLMGVKGTITPGALAASGAGTKIRIWEYNNDNGLISKYQPGITAGAGLHYPRFTPEEFCFGGNLATLGDFVVPNGTAGQGPVAGPYASSPNIEHVAGVENQLRQIVWHSETADATTQWEILVNGVSFYVTDLPLNGPNFNVNASSILAFDPVTFQTKKLVLGDRIAVRYVAGTAPGRTVIRLQ